MASSSHLHTSIRLDRARLPLELYRPILQNLHRRSDMYNLLFTSRILLHEAERQLYHTIIVDDIDKFVPLFRRLADPDRPRIANYVKHMVLPEIDYDSPDWELIQPALVAIQMSLEVLEVPDGCEVGEEEEGESPRPPPVELPKLKFLKCPADQAVFYMGDTRSLKRIEFTCMIPDTLGLRDIMEVIFMKLRLISFEQGILEEILHPFPSLRYFYCRVTEDSGREVCFANSFERSLHLHLTISRLNSSMQLTSQAFLSQSFNKWR